MKMCVWMSLRQAKERMHKQALILQLDVRFISSSDQVADGFTKSLPASKLDIFHRNLNLIKLGLRESVRICD
jgi:hypothetical protein